MLTRSTDTLNFPGKDELLLSLEKLQPDQLTNDLILSILTVMQSKQKIVNWLELRNALSKVFKQNLDTIPDRYNLRNRLLALKRQRRNLIRDNKPKLDQEKFLCERWDLPTIKRISVRRLQTSTDITDNETPPKIQCLASSISDISLEEHKQLKRQFQLVQKEKKYNTYMTSAHLLTWRKTAN